MRISMKYWYLWVIEIVIAVLISKEIMSSYGFQDIISQLGTFLIVFILTFMVLKSLSRFSFSGLFWHRLPYERVPRWVKRKASRVKWTGANQYVKFKGKHRRYRVVCVGHGTFEYYYKRR